MSPERFREVERSGAAVDLTARAKWRISGADRLRYLNGQVTQDVRRAFVLHDFERFVFLARIVDQGDVPHRPLAAIEVVFSSIPGCDEKLKFVRTRHVHFGLFHECVAGRAHELSVIGLSCCMGSAPLGRFEYSSEV